MAQAVGLMQRMGDVIGQGALLENPGAVSGQQRQREKNRQNEGFRGHRNEPKEADMGSASIHRVS